MKLKIFEAANKEVVETAYNEFGKNFDIKFGQSHVYPIVVGGSVDNVVYTIFVFYEDRAKTAVPQQSGILKTKPCPKCGESIPIGWNFHAKCNWSGGENK